MNQSSAVEKLRSTQGHGLWNTIFMKYDKYYGIKQVAVCNENLKI